jgi:hypothetical protein
MSGKFVSGQPKSRPHAVIGVERINQSKFQGDFSANRMQNATPAKP